MPARRAESRISPIRRAAAAALAGAALTVGGCGDDDAPSDTAPRVVTVDIADVTFEPRNVTVAPGTTVRWINSDTKILHTVTKVSGPGEVFDSGNVYPGMTYERRFDERGRIGYVCTLHDGQTGSVTVR